METTDRYKALRQSVEPQMEAVDLVLAVNSGSSSLKFGLFFADEEGGLQPTASGIIGRIGSSATIDFSGGRGRYGTDETIADHYSATLEVVNWLRSEGLMSETGPAAIGHRIVHGGSHFTGPALINDRALALIEEASELAPLHNPPALAALRACRDLFGDTVPMVAAFDTAFFANMPERARHYAIPGDMAERHRIFRYGFHGLAHEYMTERANALIDIPLSEACFVTLQLGNGCSATAVQGGRAIDTTMGLTPLEGLVMGTRSGDVDPSLVDLVARREKLSSAEVVDLLNTRSGLLGISGHSSDMRDLSEAAVRGNQRARLALEIFSYRVSKQIGAYAAALGRLDGVVFGGGIGEHAPNVRKRICRDLGVVGIRIDDERNEASIGIEADIADPESPVRVLVVPVDELKIIARSAVSVQT